MSSNTTDTSNVPNWELHFTNLGPSGDSSAPKVQHQPPVWIRAPKGGPEYYTGLSRAKLYELAKQGKIRTAAVKDRGKLRGSRLFLLSSILDYIARHEVQPTQPPDEMPSKGTLSVKN